MQPDELLNEIKAELHRTLSSQPLHRRLRSAIEGLVLSSTLKPGEVLPGERVLSDALDLSRVTVRKAVGALVDEGLLHRRHGAKTEVGSRVEKSLSTLTSFSEDMAARGLQPGCIWISKQISRPSPAEMMALGVPAEAQVVRLRRIRTADGVPLALETSTVPRQFLPSPDLVADSLYAALEQQGAMPQRAIQRMRSRAASLADAEHLRCPTGTPLLVMERRCFLVDGQTVEFSETRYKGDVYDFVFELRR